MTFENVTAKNALMFAMQNYDNPQCLSMAEFTEDYKRFKYIKRLCRRYITTQHLSERLMLNHLILLTNVFGVEATIRLLFVKCDDKDSFRVLKPFLSYLNLLPTHVRGVNGKTLNTDKIPTDEKLWQRLRDL
jgi:hypothetical protein